MTRSTLTRTVLACSLIAVALFTGLRPGTATPAFGATMTTVTFDDLPGGTAVSNQYDAQGVDFGSGIIDDNNVYCFPVIKQVSTQNAKSGRSGGGHLVREWRVPELLDPGRPGKTPRST